MHKLSRFLGNWPVWASLMLSLAMILGTLAEQVEVPDWLLRIPNQQPEPTDPKTPLPKVTFDTPYAPAPGRDDRTPLAYVGHVFGLNDPDLPNKFSGIGPVYWKHSGRGSGALIAKNLVLTTGHLFAENGKWEGPFGLTHKPPSTADGYIYLEACGQSYEFEAIHMGSMSPRARLGLDYAIVELATPACVEAMVLPVATTPDDLIGAEDQIFLSLGAYAFNDITRYANHPVFVDKAASEFARKRQAVFGVRCKPAGREDTGDGKDGSTAVIVTEGCDAVPGGSGGAAVLSRDGGQTYNIVGVTNSYRPNSEYNNYTRIEGAFAKHLSSFIDVIELPPTSTISTPPSHIEAQQPLGQWEELNVMEGDQ